MNNTYLRQLLLQTSYILEAIVYRGIGVYLLALKVILWRLKKAIGSRMCCALELSPPVPLLALVFFPIIF